MKITSQQALPKETTFFIWDDSEDWLTCIKQAFDQYNLYESNVWINSSVRAVDILDIQSVYSAQFLNGVDFLENLRAVKNPRQLSYMKQASRYADEVMDEIRYHIKPGKSEKDIKDKIIDLFSKKGVTPSFTPIVASGSNNSKPHYNDDRRIIKEKDVVLLDFGCLFEGYCSDTSRTFFVGRITEKEKKIYNIVREAFDAASNHVKEGVTAEEVDKIARDIIVNAGYGECFINRTGHGIGCEVHEAPYIRGGNQQVLEKGMAFSIEPGIYIAGELGIRIEDIMIINETGQGESINKSSKEIIVIK